VGVLNLPQQIQAAQHLTRQMYKRKDLFYYVSCMTVQNNTKKITLWIARPAVSTIKDQSMVRQSVKV
jgi:hypothetical protein